MMHNCEDKQLQAQEYQKTNYTEFLLLATNNDRTEALRTGSHMLKRFL